MVRQAHTYLVGAMSGVTLIAIAIAAFVLLVSTQVFTDWPIAGLGGSDEAAVSDAQPVGSGAEGPAGAGAAAAAGTTTAAGAGATAGGGANAGNGAGNTQLDGSGSVQPGSSSGEPSAGGGGGQGGSGNGRSAPNAPSANPSSPASGGSAGGGSSAASSPSQTVTTTVNETVKKVDESVLGGALDNTGVPDLAEDVVNGVAGPESTVGKVVDGVAGTVGGLLNPKR
jgi:hypothetical protein